MSTFVYHYTDTARLPWILRDRELRPGRNQYGGFPDPDFLWATTMPIPDATASPAGQKATQALREGRTRLVRFTLRADDFCSWPAIVADYPAWTPGEVRRLEKAAHGKSNPKHWRCRAEALPRAAWVAVETRGWVDREWRPLDPDAELVNLGVETGDDCLGVWIGDLAYFSGLIPQANGSVGYTAFAGRQGEAA